MVDVPSPFLPSPRSSSKNGRCTSHLCAILLEKHINLLLRQKSIVNRWLAIVNHWLAIVHHWLAIVTRLARLLQFVGSHWLTSL